jgi:apolipoprotein N-acyltransferase
MSLFFNRSSFQLSIICGILIGISYPPIPGITAWFGFVPLIHIWLNESPKESARWSFFSAIIANSISFYWIGLNSGASLFPVLLSLISCIIYLSSMWALIGWFIALIEKRFQNALSMIPFIWVTFEWLRSFGPLGFPWANLAITQTKFLPLIQMIDTTGSEGVGFWILLLNSLIYLLLRDLTFNKKLVTSLILVFLIPWTFGTMRLQSFDKIENSDSRTVSGIQPNINPNQKWDVLYRDRLYTIMDSLNAEAYSFEPDLVLWPEAALPAYMRVSSLRNKYESLVKKTKIPLLMGTVDYKYKLNERLSYNGAIYFGKNENKIYHKNFLVPFAEYIPLSNNFKILKKLNFGQANFSHGNKFTTFPLDSVYFGNLICYESSHPFVAKKFIQNGARFLTIEANDAWLRNSSGVRQHFELARLRAIEQRVGIVRSANTGISGIIKPSGRVDHKVDFGEQEVFNGKVILNDKITFYGTYGSVFSQICFILTFMQFIWLIKRQK